MSFTTITSTDVYMMILYGGNEWCVVDDDHSDDEISQDYNDGSADLQKYNGDGIDV